MVYQNLKNITEEKEYWDKYIKFHELYWDGPNASQNVFYGNEYEEYRSSLSKYLEVEPDIIKDCLFTKHENGEYFLTPLGVDSDKYIMESENIIPPHWFLMFENSEKKFFYSHAGDGAVQPDGIYYNTEITKRNAYSMQEVIGSSVPTNVLVVHHEEDCCKVCEPVSARQFYEELKIKNKALNMVSGGGSSGSCHGPFHHHGFEGVEQIVVEGLVSWVTSKIK